MTLRDQLDSEFSEPDCELGPFSGTDFDAAADFTIKVASPWLRDYIFDSDRDNADMVSPEVPTPLRSPRSRTRRRTQKPATLRDELAPGHIRFHLDSLMRKAGLVNRTGRSDTRGKTSLLGLSRRSGISPNTCWQLLRHPETINRLELGTLARLCAALGCQPGDLLEYVPNDAPPVRNAVDLSSRKVA
jgi:putative transcriptional regulator